MFDSLVLPWAYVPLLAGGGALCIILLLQLVKLWRRPSGEEDATASRRLATLSATAVLALAAVAWLLLQISPAGRGAVAVGLLVLACGAGLFALTRAHDADADRIEELLAYRDAIAFDFIPFELTDQPRPAALAPPLDETLGAWAKKLDAAAGRGRVAVWVERGRSERKAR